MSRVIEQIKTGLSYSFFNPLRLSNIVSFRSPAWGGGGPGGLSSANEFWQNCPLLNIPVGICHLCQISPQFGSGAGRWR